MNASIRAEARAFMHPLLYLTLMDFPKNLGFNTQFVAIPAINACALHLLTSVL